MQNFILEFLEISYLEIPGRSSSMLRNLTHALREWNNVIKHDYKHLDIQYVTYCMLYTVVLLAAFLLAHLLPNPRKTRVSKNGTLKPSRGVTIG